MSGTSQPLPQGGSQAEDDAIAAAIVNIVNAEVPGGELFDGVNRGISFRPNDVVITTAPNVQLSGDVGSLTDRDGNTWTLVAGTSADGNAPAWWWGGIKLNGVMQWPGYDCAIRLVDGNVFVEESKFSGWWSLTDTHEGHGKVFVADPGGGAASNPIPPPFTPVPPGSSAAPPPPASGVGGTPSPPNHSSNIITAGDGSTLIDPAGNVFSVDASGNAIENGSPMPDGSGTSALALVNVKIEGQDSSSQQWFIWNGSAWTPGAAGPDSTIVVGLGVDKALTGGGGNITFLLDGGGHADSITDFQPSDHLEFQNVANAAVLTANDIVSTVVTFGSDTVILSGVAGSSLSANNFIFPSGDSVNVIINGHSS
jgi:hypothetical protein